MFFIVSYFSFSGLVFSAWRIARKARIPTVDDGRNALTDYFQRAVFWSDDDGH